LAGATVALLGLAVWGRVVRTEDPVEIASVRRDLVLELRAEVDACLSVRDRIQLRFEALRARTDSLRAEVDWAESLDSRGVPGALYPRYLELVAEFNDSVVEWERETVDLRETSGECRNLVSTHNEQVDSLQAYLVESGIWAEEWLEPLLDRPDDGAPDEVPLGGSARPVEPTPE
jgi:hypothetical protein